MITTELKTIDEFLQNFYKSNPFTTDVGINLFNISPEQVTISLDIAKRHTNVYGIAHGGVVVTMMDMAMGAACLHKGAKVVTLNINNNFIKALKIKDVAYATGKIRHAGKTTLVANCELYNQNKELCATATGTFLRIGNVEL